MNLEGKAGIVSGSGRGIGRAVALLMAKEGAKVVVNDPGVGRNGEEARSMHKFNKGGMFSIDEQAASVPGSLLACVR